MGAAVAAIASVVAGAASAVATVVVPIASTIAAAVGPVVSIVGSVLSAITSALGAAVAPIASTVGGVASFILKSIGLSAGSLLKTVGDAVGPFLTGLGDAIKGVTGLITKTTAPILEPIKAGLELVNKAVQQVARWVTTAFHPSARMAELKAAHPELWEMSQGYESTFLSLLQGDGIITATEASLLTLPDVLATVNQVATLKILGDLVQGQAKVSEFLSAVANGSAFETAAAIAQLSKNIVSTSVNVLDRVDTEVGILRATMDSFDERLKRSLDQYAMDTRNVIIGQVTPKLDVLGRNQLELNRRIAAIIRHVDDQVWFYAMLARALP